MSNGVPVQRLPPVQKLLHLLQPLHHVGVGDQIVDDGAEAANGTEELRGLEEGVLLVTVHLHEVDENRRRALDARPPRP